MRNPSNKNQKNVIRKNIRLLLKTTTTSNKNTQNKIKSINNQKSIDNIKY